MAEFEVILDQLGLDWTFFAQFGIFCVLFTLMGPLVFKPFLKLIEIRHKGTVVEREAAEKMLLQAEAKMKDYELAVASGRLDARK